MGRMKPLELTKRVIVRIQHICFIQFAPTRFIPNLRDSSSSTSRKCSTCIPSQEFSELWLGNFFLLARRLELLFDRAILLRENNREGQNTDGPQQIPDIETRGHIVPCMPPLKNVHGGTTSELPIMARIAVTDGMAPAAVALLEKAGHEVVLGYIEKSICYQAHRCFDAIIVRSTTKLTQMLSR